MAEQVTMSSVTAAYSKASADLTTLTTKLHAAFQAHDASKRALADIQTAYSDAKNSVGKLTEDMEREVSKVDEPLVAPTYAPGVHPVVPAKV